MENNILWWIREIMLKLIQARNLGLQGRGTEAPSQFRNFNPPWKIWDRFHFNFTYSSFVKGKIIRVESSSQFIMHNLIIPIGSFKFYT